MMNKTLTILFSFLLLISRGFAANDNIPTGSRSAGMAHASIAINDVWAIQHNQAALGNINNMEAAVFSQLIYPNSSVMMNAVAVASPFKYGVLGATFNRMGYKNLYNESKYGIAYARQFGKTVSAGMQFNYLTTHIGDNNYGSRGTVAIEAGILVEVIKNLKLGAHIYNPTRSRTAQYNNERVPTILKVGLQYTFSDKVFSTIEVEKNISNKPVFKLGVEYHIAKEIYLRGGLSTNPSLNSAGFGIELKKFNIDFAAAFHPQLGVSPQIGLRYSFLDQQKEK
ncbi:MAG: hypothetical protein IT238_10975 [Bacteroidia bacterium]|nr:hypothetical protein [Bacteroidia bacterium]MCZ2248265.1 hypothetical protein [Bacteroidia bacterium]